MDWEDAQKLYDQLMKSRRELAWLQMEDQRLIRIRDEAAKALSENLNALEATVAPYRVNQPASTAKEE